jgi:micrococcal nuclease
MLTMLAATTLFACSATDGDTIRCASRPGGSRSTRVRLLGIDAPELTGHCRRGRICAPGDPIASRSSLARAMAGRTIVATQIFGTDRYGRLLALVSAGGSDLSCWQLRQRQAIYKPRWDNRAALRRSCRAPSIG